MSGRDWATITLGAIEVGGGLIVLLLALVAAVRRRRSRP